MAPRSIEAFRASSILARIVGPALAGHVGTREQPHHQRHEKSDQKQEEQQFRDPHRSGGDPAEPEQRGDDRDDEKSECPTEHCALPRFFRSMPNNKKRTKARSSSPKRPL